jgi:hypothetical protein
MEISKIVIKNGHAVMSDQTSCHDSYPNLVHEYTNVTAIISVRNDDIPPFEVMMPIPTDVKDTLEYIRSILFELS